MITSEDFISRPYTPDLTQAGIDHVHHSTHYFYNRSLTHRLQRIISSVAVELSFRRYLGAQKVPHENLSTSPFTDPGRYDIAIGGRRCNIKLFLVCQKNRIQAINKDPGTLLQGDVLIPVDEMKSSQLSEHDIYIFAFLTTLLTPNQYTLQKAYQAGQPIHLIHALPKAWAGIHHWASLGKIALKSNGSDPIEIRLKGHGQNKIRQHEQILLHSHQRTTIEEDFYALHYLYTTDFPDDIVGIHSPTLNHTHMIEPPQWENIWVYGMKIIFTGYITREEFRRRGYVTTVGSHDFQYPNTQTQNMAIPMRLLHPITDLFARAKIWHKAKK